MNDGFVLHKGQAWRAGLQFSLGVKDDRLGRNWAGMWWI